MIYFLFAIGYKVVFFSFINSTSGHLGCLLNVPIRGRWSKHIKRLIHHGEKVMPATVEADVMMKEYEQPWPIHTHNTRAFCYLPLLEADLISSAALCLLFLSLNPPPPIIIVVNYSKPWKVWKGLLDKSHFAWILRKCTDLRAFALKSRNIVTTCPFSNASTLSWRPMSDLRS